MAAAFLKCGIIPTVNEPSLDQLRELLDRLEAEPADAIESDTVECKGWDPAPAARERQLRELRETVVCLANARGGVILLGVADRKRSRLAAIQGAGRLDPLELRRRIYDGTSPHILVDVEELVEPEGRLLVVRVPRGLPPHTTSEGVGKIRVGKDCQPLTGAELARLLTQGGRRDPSAEPIPGTSIAELDEEVLKRLRRQVEAEGQSPELVRLPDVDLLGALGLLVGGECTLAALLLLGGVGALRRWVPGHEVLFFHFRSDTSYDVRRDLRGPILVVLDRLQELFEAHLAVAPFQADLFLELHVPDLPRWTAREAVINALVHRDYFLRQPVQIELRRDRTVITSPGGFLGGVTPENLLRHAPVRRNSLLAETLQQLGLVNRAGLGVDRIYEELLSWGKGLPRYEADESHVALTLPTRTHEPFARFVADQRRQGRSLALDDLIVLRAVVERGAIDRWSAAKVLQLPDPDHAAGRLVTLREQGYLKPHGRGRGTSYSLVPSLEDRLRGSAVADLEAEIDRESVRLRLLTVLRKRGRLTNSDVRRLGGLSRDEALRLVQRLRAEGLVTLVGRGRGAHYVAGPGLR